MGRVDDDQGEVVKLGYHALVHLTVVDGEREWRRTHLMRSVDLCNNVGRVFIDCYSLISCVALISFVDPCVAFWILVELGLASLWKRRKSHEINSTNTRTYAVSLAFLDTKLTQTRGI